jgi:hypothetical protein
MIGRFISIGLWTGSPSIDVLATETRTTTECFKNYRCDFARENVVRE